MRIIYRTPEFDEFFDAADEQLRSKIFYLSDILENIPIINSKVSKKLTNTILHEVRIQIISVRLK